MRDGCIATMHKSVDRYARDQGTEDILLIFGKTVMYKAWRSDAGRVRDRFGRKREECSFPSGINFDEKKNHQRQTKGIPLLHLARL